MKQLIYTCVIIFSTLLNIDSASAQRRNLQDALQKSTLDSQFFYLGTMSKTQDIDFKIVRKTNIDLLRKNTSDTINRLKSEITQLKQSTSSQSTTTTDLQEKISTLESELSKEKEVVENIVFLGISFSKSTYHTLVWSLIIVFALAFLLSFFAYRKSKADTNIHKRTADDVQEELHVLRKKSMEREQQLKRQLLDEQMKRNS